MTETSTIRGSIIGQATIHDMIEEGCLCDYRIFVYDEDPEQAMKDTGDTMDTLSDTEDNIDILSDTGVSNDPSSDTEDSESFRKLPNCLPHLQKLADELGRRHILVFYNTCEAAKSQYELTKNTMFRAYYMDGNTSKQDRLSIFSAFQTLDDENVHVLFNVNTVSEGVSLPVMDSILFMECRNSQLAVTQIIGRALRSHPSKTEAIICIPSRCVNTFDNLATALWVDAEQSRCKAIDTVRKRFISNSAKSCKFTNMRTSWLEICRTGGSWMYQYERFKGFHINPENVLKSSSCYKTDPNLNSLAQWWSHQKTHWKNAKLSEERVNKLLELPVCQEWVTDMIEKVDKVHVTKKRRIDE
jgi:superfamily II DNA or RNA helicase